MPYPYTGLVASDFLPIEVGRSLPQSQWGEDAGWHLGFVGNVPESSFFEGDYGHVFRLIGSSAAAPLTRAMTPTMTPEQLQRLDAKFDDGKANKGAIRTPRLDTCASGTDYDLSLNTVECEPIWITGF